jgi:hypothetical protein
VLTGKLLFLIECSKIFFFLKSHPQEYARYILIEKKHGAEKEAKTPLQLASMTMGRGQVSQWASAY